MLKVTNNPELLKLIGRRFHVRDVTEHPDYPKHVQQLLINAALNADMFVHSIIFNADCPPEIGIVENMDDPDHMEYYRSAALVFSPPSGSLQPLPAGLFRDDGTLVAILDLKQAEAA